MGIIGRETIKGTVYSYLGAAVGFISLVILSPRIFTPEQIGLTQVMVAISTIVAQLGGLGFGNVTNRLFPYFRTRDGNHTGYLTLASIVTITGFLISFVIIRIYMPEFIANNKDKSELLSEYAYLIPLLFGLIMLFNLLDNFCKVLFNAAIGIILREFVLRIINLLLIVLYFSGVMNFDSYVISYVIAFGIPVVVIVVYLISRGEFKFGSFNTIIDRNFVRHMISLCLFGIISGLSGIALTTIDKYMVNNYMGLGDAGVYSIAAYFATLILIPARALSKISVPVIAEAWKRDDRKEIQMIYYKSSINQLAIGQLLFLGIICNLKNIFDILPPIYQNGELVIIFIGAANLAKASLGVGSNILATSKFFRLQTYLMILLLGIFIVTNYFLIPLMGIKGAALASLISLSITSIVTLLFLYIKFGIWPFDKKHLILFGIGVLTFLAISLLPQMSMVIDILVRSILITLIYIVLLRILNISEEATKMFNSLVRFITEQLPSQHK